MKKLLELQSSEYLQNVELVYPETFLEDLPYAMLSYDTYGMLNYAEITKLAYITMQREGKLKPVVRKLFKKDINQYHFFNNLSLKLLNYRSDFKDDDLIRLYK